MAKNAILATALNPVIGYLKAAEVAKKAAASDRSIREVVVEEGILTPEQADELLDARRDDGGRYHDTQDRPTGA